MFNATYLTTTIQNRLNNDPTLISIKNKIAYGYLPEKLARPKCRYQIIDDSQRTGFGTKFLNSVNVQFSVWADSLTVAADLAEKIGLSLHGLSDYSSGMRNISALVRGGHKVITEPGPDYVVYQVVIMVEFRVQN